MAELKGWLSGIRISGDLSVWEEVPGEDGEGSYTLHAQAGSTTAKLTWYDGKTPDVKGFMRNFAPTFYPDQDYHPGDIVSNDLNIYVCQNEVSAGEFNPNDWSEPVDVKELINMLSPKQIHIGDDEPVDEEVLWIDTDEDYPEADIFIRYDAAQSLTEEQKKIAKANVGAEDEIYVQTAQPTIGKLWIDTDEDPEQASELWSQVINDITNIKNDIIAIKNFIHMP